MEKGKIGFAKSLAKQTEEVKNKLDSTKGVIKEFFVNLRTIQNGNPMAQGTWRYEPFLLENLRKTSNFT